MYLSKWHIFEDDEEEDYFVHQKTVSINTTTLREYSVHVSCQQVASCTKAFYFNFYCN